MLVAVVAFAAAINEFVLLLPSDEQAIVRLVGQYCKATESNTVLMLIAAIYAKPILIPSRRYI